MFQSRVSSRSPRLVVPARRSYADRADHLGCRESAADTVSGLAGTYVDGLAVGPDGHTLYVTDTNLGTNVENLQIINN